MFVLSLVGTPAGRCMWRGKLVRTGGRGTSSRASSAAAAATSPSAAASTTPSITSGDDLHFNSSSKILWLFCTHRVKHFDSWINDIVGGNLCFDVSFDTKVEKLKARRASENGRSAGYRISFGGSRPSSSNGMRRKCDLPHNRGYALDMPNRKDKNYRKLLKATRGRISRIFLRCVNISVTRLLPLGQEEELLHIREKEISKICSKIL